MAGISDGGDGLHKSSNAAKPIVRRSGGSFIISWGKFGGWYFHRGYTTRLCLGWLALTYFPCEVDDLLDADDAAI